ncbi:MAG: putative toxin-antitoxin system toxin component, PIN family [Burkholderiales bacterium]
MRIVVDTDVFVSALLGAGAANTVVSECLGGRFVPLMGPALLGEYESLLGRSELFAKCRLTERERQELFDIFIAKSRWIRVYFGWRPNLRDEGDNHIIELAVAGDAKAIVTRNTRDFTLARQLHFPQLQVVTPTQLLKGDL